MVLVCKAPAVEHSGSHRRARHCSLCRARHRRRALLLCIVLYPLPGGRDAETGTDICPMVQSSAHCIALSTSPAKPLLMRGRAQIRAEGVLAQQMRCLASTTVPVETHALEPGWPLSRSSTANTGENQLVLQSPGPTPTVPQCHWCAGSTCLVKVAIDLRAGLVQ